MLSGRGLGNSEGSVAKGYCGLALRAEPWNRVTGVRVVHTQNRAVKPGQTTGAPTENENNRKARIEPREQHHLPQGGKGNQEARGHGSDGSGTVTPKLLTELLFLRSINLLLNASQQQPRYAVYNPLKRFRGEKPQCMLDQILKIQKNQLCKNGSKAHKYSSLQPFSTHPPTGLHRKQ